MTYCIAMVIKHPVNELSLYLDDNRTSFPRDDYVGNRSVSNRARTRLFNSGCKPFKAQSGPNIPL